MTILIKNISAIISSIFINAISFGPYGVIAKLWLGLMSPADANAVTFYTAPITAWIFVTLMMVFGVIGAIIDCYRQKYIKIKKSISKEQTLISKKALYAAERLLMSDKTILYNFNPHVTISQNSLANARRIYSSQKAIHSKLTDYNNSNLIMSNQKLLLEMLSKKKYLNIYYVLNEFLFYGSVPFIFLLTINTLIQNILALSLAKIIIPAIITFSLVIGVIRAIAYSKTLAKEYKEDYKLARNMSYFYQKIINSMDNKILAQ